MPKKNFEEFARCERISLSGIQLLAFIGVYPRERRAPQPVWVDVELDADLLSAARSDSLEQTHDYGAIAEDVVTVAGAHHRSLIETLAYDIAHSLLGLPRVRVARVTVHKPGAVPLARDTAVTIELARGRK